MVDFGYYRLFKQVPDLEPPKLLWIALVIAILLIIVGVARGEDLQASWYSRESLVKEGTWKNGIERRMANGERFDNNKLTAACRIYAIGQRLKITNNENKKSVCVVVTDRIGKRFSQTRIDLSAKAFSFLAPLSQGVIPVKVEVINDLS